MRPIFDWSEVGETFKQASQQVDYTFLTQLLTSRVQDISQSVEDLSAVQSQCTKVVTVIQNLILTGEGEELMLEEVRAVGSMKTMTSLAGNMVADVVVLLKDVPDTSMVTRMCYKVADILNSANEEHRDEESDSDGLITVQILSEFAFELADSKNVITRVYVTTLGAKIYSTNAQDNAEFRPFREHLRMIRHSRWWEDNAAHLKSIHNLVRILKDMKKHIPGLQSLNPWYIQLLANCAVIPLVGDQPLSLTDAFKRVWELLSGGLFLPGSIGIPDPCEESDVGIHDNLAPHECDELTRNAQTILMMLSYGAYREVLAVEGASPVKFNEPYSFGGVTLDIAAPAVDRPTT